MVIRRAFPQIYELEHPKNGRYWLVSARKYGMTQRKTFQSKTLVLKHAEDIEDQFRKHGAQTDVPKEKVVMAERYGQLAEKVGTYGLSLEEAVDQLMRYKGDEIVRSAKPFIRDLVEQWKAFKYTKKGMSSRFVSEIHSYARFVKRKWGDIKPDDLKRNDIELMLNISWMLATMHVPVNQRAWGECLPSPPTFLVTCLLQGGVSLAPLQTRP